MPPVGCTPALDSLLSGAQIVLPINVHRCPCKSPAISSAATASNRQTLIFCLIFFGKKIVPDDNNLFTRNA